ncbi:MAG TPA: TatD family hydrolase [Candidatus Saccharimonadales bacterium]
MEFIDTHCHLQFEKYGDRQAEVLTDAARSGVKRLISVGTTLDDSQAAAELARTQKAVWATTGSHPHDALKFLANPNARKELKRLAQLPRVVAIGETGLDFYKQISAKDEQERALRAHIEVGLELGLPLAFHVRDAWADFWRVFDSFKGIEGVVHSFSTDSGHLDEILSRGLYIGLNGIMTFTKDHNQLEAARAVPLDKLLLETDAPFLTPAPFRGQICEPKHVLPIAEFLAELRGENLEELATATTANAVKLFNLDKG